MSALERNFECGRCGTRGVAVVAAEASKTPWKMVEDGALSSRDGMATQDDASRTLGLIRCPGCNERGRFALGFSIARVIGYVIGGLLAILIIGGRILRYVLIREMNGSTFFLVVLILAALGAAVEVRRWRAAARVSFIKVRQLPLPVAVAQVVTAPPKIKTPPPIQPVRTSAPETVERAADGDGPRFLKGR